MAQTTSPSQSTPAAWIRWIPFAIFGLIAVAAIVLYPQWEPAARPWLAKILPSAAGEAGPVEGKTEEAGHASHGSNDSIELSLQGRKNIGLTDEFIKPVKLQAFTKSIRVPGIVVERPGRSVIEVTAPFTGVVTRIYPTEGEALEPGRKLFDLRLTHEDLVQSQADLLQTAAEQEVTDKEIARLDKLAIDGTIPGKRLLELKYEKDKSDAVLRARRQALLLHGLTEAQVDGIVQKRELFKEMTVTVANVSANGKQSQAGNLFQVQGIKVAQGQQVDAGDTLAILADHAELYIEGEAFERDVADLNRVAESQAPIAAVLETDGDKGEVIENLRLLYLSTKIDPAKRTLDFYVTLPNQPQRDSKYEDGRRFIAWKYRPGQRVQLEIPLQVLPNRIVLPIDALAQDGTETYVFTPNGKGFERRSVHVEYRDPRQVVIASDGSVFPGDMVALTGAQQLQVAIKNKSGGAPDPHAGHSH
ncbi:efflux RND transporter periplasmic adaptor subunit [Anatilimnocola sp. NA78]|uniref:efflux RND transporter periplasmic adaptor subunit n=1 Tax=Anatilimnocola sp. NA78 TaxID=3415683 RepID=UPI003CE4A4BB